MALRPVACGGLYRLSTAMSLRDFALLVGVCLVWAMNSIVSKLVISHMGVPPLFYAAARFAVVVAFTFFYTSVVFSQQRIAENLQKSGGAVPGIRRAGPNSSPL